MPRKKKGNPEMKNNKMKEAMDEAAKDERFSKVLENPLYRRVPKKEKSVTIDKRFQSMFHVSYDLKEYYLLHFCRHRPQRNARSAVRTRTLTTRIYILYTTGNRNIIKYRITLRK